ncbi:hypothetical protein K8R43_05340 [archaeon]|nr:hypothetical protein [archaeon]
MIKKSFKLMIAMVLLCSLSWAIPGIPHQFYGNVQVNGQPASDGTEVIAKIDGVEVSSGTTINGKFGYSPNVFIITDANSNRLGKTVSFLAAGKDTGVTAIFDNGASTQVDFSVTVQQNNNNNGGGGGSSGSSGGGDSGGSAVSQDLAQAEYQVGDVHVIRSYYYDGNNVIMKLVYENTGDETLYNIEITDPIGGDFGIQNAYFHAIEPGEKKYDEYELGKWTSLYQMNDLVEAAAAPSISVGQVGIKEAPVPEPIKEDTQPRDEGVIPPEAIEIKEETPSSATGLFSLETGMLALGLVMVLLIIIIVVAVHLKNKKAAKPASKNRLKPKTKKSK